MSLRRRWERWRRDGLLVGGLDETIGETVRCLEDGLVTPHGQITPSGFRWLGAWLNEGDDA